MFLLIFVPVLSHLSNGNLYLDSGLKIDDWEASGGAHATCLGVGGFCC